jgi:RNA polymerase sigma factor (sigma-70 family)
VRGLKRDRLLDEIETIYRQRYASFLRVAAAITQDEEAGRDAVQDGFAGAVRGRHGYRGRGTVEAWLWRSVVNAARTRRSMIRRVEPLVHEAPSDESVTESPLRSALAALPERQRLVVFLRYFADLDYRTIARVAGIRTGTVSATLSAAHESLRTTLKEELHV